MLDWDAIDTVFLDMDGTLLDLHFDNYFWQQHVPQRYAEQCGMTIDQAKEELVPRFRAAEGSMEWYCVDYWSRQLGMDVALLKAEVAHLIREHPQVINFLLALKRTGKRRVLVTNAHTKSLELKLKHTTIGAHLDRIICAHDFGMPKEVQAFWGKLKQRELFDPARTLLIDDSLAVLQSAHGYGIKHLMAVHRPDSKAPVRVVAQFYAIRDFKEIMPA